MPPEKQEDHLKTSGREALLPEKQEDHLKTNWREAIAPLKSGSP